MGELPVSCGSPAAVCPAARRADKTAEAAREHAAGRHVSAAPRIAVREQVQRRKPGRRFGWQPESSPLVRDFGHDPALLAEQVRNNALSRGGAPTWATTSGGCRRARPVTAFPYLYDASSMMGGDARSPRHAR